MKKTQLIIKIHQYLESKTKKVRSNPGSVFLAYFAQYLDRLVIPADEKDGHWHIDQYLPEIIADAYEQLRAAETSLTKNHAALYRAAQINNEGVPNLLDLGASRGVDQIVTVMRLASDISEIVGEPWLKERIERYCLAQHSVLEQAFDKFSRHVYRCGLYEVIKKCKQRGMAGQFGATELRSYVMAGRIMFTFARKTGKDEINVSFVAGEDELFLFTAGEQTCNATLRQALAMIDEVILRWPSKQWLQERIFAPAKGVKLDAVAALQVVV